MIAYLQGKLTHKTATNVYIDVGGIAYDLNISLNTFAVIEALEEAKLFTQLIVRENEQSLYGFFDLEEKVLFSKLLSVSGIGPNTARVILSYMTPKETKQAILYDNVAAFKKVKGVGPKTAQRIILDLKDKIAKENMDETLTPIASAANSLRDEAIAALSALGFQKTQIHKSVDKILANHPEIQQVEALIKMVLKQL